MIAERLTIAERPRPIQIGVQHHPQAGVGRGAGLVRRSPRHHFAFTAWMDPVTTVFLTGIGSFVARQAWSSWCRSSRNPRQRKDNGKDNGKG
jgi:hypothetical protein